MTEFQFKKAESEDVGKLLEISIATFTETFAELNTKENMKIYLEENLTLNQLSTELNNTNSFFYLAFCNQMLAGYMKLNLGNEQPQKINDESVELERIYVLKKFQDKGLGKFLLENAFRFVRSNQLNCIWLGVWEHNHKAINFYKKYGFTAYGHHLFRLGNDNQKDLLMKLYLS